MRRLDGRCGDDRTTSRHQRQRFLAKPKKRGHVHPIRLLKLLCGKVGNLVHGVLLAGDRREDVESAQVFLSVLLE
jgi:hypothetical protein